tara:strand:- start:1262 stop:1504 length:243 start_codon:yes stop_codon:yes gene_type:complete
VAKVATKRKKPPAPKLEQEARAFIDKKASEKSPVDEGLSQRRQQLAASVVAGLLAKGGVTRAEELVEEAFRYVDLILEHN